MVSWINVTGWAGVPELLQMEGPSMLTSTKNLAHVV